MVYRIGEASGVWAIGYAGVVISLNCFHTHFDMLTLLLPCPSACCPRKGMGRKHNIAMD